MINILHESKAKLGLYNCVTQGRANYNGINTTMQQSEINFLSETDFDFTFTLHRKRKINVLQMKTYPDWISSLPQPLRPERVAAVLPQWWHSGLKDKQ